MPLYEFVCHDCKCEQELLVRAGEEPTCEKCGGRRLAKLLSVPAAHTAGDGGGSPGPSPGRSCGGGCACHPH